MPSPRRLLPSVAAAVSLAALVFGLCELYARSPFGPPPPPLNGRMTGGMMHGMETTPPPSAESKEASGDVLAVLRGERDLGRTLTLFRLSGLLAALEQTGSITVFAPTDEAFEKLDRPAYVDLLEPANAALLRSTMSRHLVPGALSPAGLQASDGLVTLDGRELRVETRGRELLVGGAAITERTRAANGWVYRLDSVLLPPSK